MLVPKSLLESRYPFSLSRQRPEESLDLFTIPRVWDKWDDDLSEG